MCLCWVLHTSKWIHYYTMWLSTVFQSFWYSVLEQCGMCVVLQSITVPTSQLFLHSVLFQYIWRFEILTPPIPMVQSCLNVLKLFKMSSVKCTWHCYLISHPSPKIFLHTIIYYSSFSLSLTHTQMISNLQLPHLTDQFYTQLQTNFIFADMLSENFNIFNNPNFIYEGGPKNNRNLNVARAL
jgi:hypothetical protein